MNKRELLKLLADKNAQFEEKRSTASVEELRALSGEMKEIRERLDLMAEVEEVAKVQIEEERQVVNRAEERSLDLMSEAELEKEYTGAFLRALRSPNSVSERDEALHVRMRELRVQDAPTANPYFKSAVDADGGLIVPKDVQTRINEYKRQGEFDLTTLITVEQTAFTSGERVFEKLATLTPFAPISEWDKIEDIASPQFEKKTYTMKDYAGILPIPRRLLQDTDQNLLDHVARFIARKTLVTRNSVILTLLKTFQKRAKAVGVTDDLKDILNVELDQAFSTTAVVVTNQDGWNWLDKCKDENGNYLIQRDVTGGTAHTIFAHNVVVVPNRTLPTDGKKAPLFIGDLKEAVILFDRGLYEITGTEVGGKAFERNSFDIRVIDRFDAQKWDEGAVVYTEIDTTKAPAMPSTAPKS